MCEVKPTTGSKGGKNVWAKYGNRNIITEKPNKYITWKKNSKDSKKFRRGKYTSIHIEQLLKIPNLKTPGHDGKHGLLLKNVTFTYNRQVIEMPRCLEGANIPEWMPKRDTTPPKKLKTNHTNNCRSIMSIQMMMKLLTSCIWEVIYNSLISQVLFTEELKYATKKPEETENYYDWKSKSKVKK